VAVTAVFFDIGETLLNEKRAWSELGRRAGLAPHVVWAGMGAVIELGRRPRDVFERLGVEHPGAVDWEAFEWYPDAVPCLRRLRGLGYFVGLAGNVGADPAEFFPDAGVDVDLVASSATLGVEKPAPEFFAKLIEVAGRAPNEVAYVGDRVDNDVVPASRAGMVAVHIRRGPWGYLQDGSRHAHVQIASLDELPEALHGL
jgi:FMN phosphatase YigB (HAD superfamily)